MALEVSNDPEHRFELAVHLKKLEVAFEIATESDSEAKWKQLGDMSMADWKVDDPFFGVARVHFQVLTHPFSLVIFNNIAWIGRGLLEEGQ